jgi:hypothetical protein
MTASSSPAGTRCPALPGYYCSATRQAYALLLQSIFKHTTSSMACNNDTICTVLLQLTYSWGDSGEKTKQVGCTLLAPCDTTAGAVIVAPTNCCQQGLNPHTWMPSLLSPWPARPLLQRYTPSEAFA